jgi:tetratricopeptide (TPR) repeat protein
MARRRDLTLRSRRTARFLGPPAFERAIALHGEGALDQAAEICRAIPVGDRHHADALHNLGTICLQGGQNEQAAGLLREALRIKPEFAEARNSLGSVLMGLGRLEEAEACYREAVRLKPEGAARHNKLGNVLRALGRRDEAEACCREALRLDPKFADAHNSLGIVLRDVGRTAEAEACFREAVCLKPEFAAAHNNLGALLRDFGGLSEAEACGRAAVRLNPKFAEAHNTLGVVLRDLGRFDEAEACYREALRHRPDYAEAHNNLGIVLGDLARPHEAISHCDRAIAITPYDALALSNRAMEQLRLGDFENGWSGSEWRWSAAGLPSRFAQPLWAGEEIGERILLLHAEQGLGDTIQFCRYVPLFASKTRVILEVPGTLVRLLSSLSGGARIIAEGEPLPPFDLHCPLMSLPLAFGTRHETIPATMPYLAAQPARAEAWRQRLADLAGLRVGLVWAGSPFKPARVTMDRRRSITLDRFAAFAEVPGLSFVSLQKGAAAGQTRSPPPGLVIHDWTEELEDFADTAALIAALDMVISVDTSVVHLAGALGKPVWLLNRFDSCWRWLLDRDDSPWYPSLRQFRQPSPGDWGSVLERVAGELARLAAGTG